MARSRMPRRSISSVASIADELIGEDRLLLDRRAAMGAANAGEHRRNMPVARVERLAALAVMPADAGEPALQSGD